MLYSNWDICFRSRGLMCDCLARLTSWGRDDSSVLQFLTISQVDDTLVGGGVRVAYQTVPSLTQFRLGSVVDAASFAYTVSMPGGDDGFSVRFDLAVNSFTVLKCVTREPTYCFDFLAALITRLSRFSQPLSSCRFTFRIIFIFPACVSVSLFNTIASLFIPQSSAGHIHFQPGGAHFLAARHHHLDLHAAAAKTRARLSC